MAITNTDVKQSYSCNGSTTGFDFSFPVADSSHVKAKLRHVTTGAETELTATTQFEVSSDSGTYESGGTVTTVTYASGSRALYAWSANYTLILYRETPVVQGSTYADNRVFKQSTFMSDLDKLTMIVQEMDDAQDRCLKAPVTDTTALTIPNSTERAGMYLAFDSSGNPVAVSGEGLSSDIVTEFAETLLDDTTAEDARATLGSTRTTYGYSLMNAADAAAGRALLAITDSTSVKSVKYYGAVGNGSTDDGPAIQLAHDALPSSGGMIYLPYAEDGYLIETKISITKPVYFYGDGWGSFLQGAEGIDAIIEVNAGGAGSIFWVFRINGSKTTTGGIIQRGIYINGAADCTIQQICFSGPNTTTGLNFGVDVLAQASNRAKVLYNRFERMVSSSGNGTAILNEYSSYNKIIGNEIDGTNFVNADSAPGAAIFLSATISGGGIGSTHNLVSHNRIINHPQAGIDINSTTYAEWATQLGECSNNRIEHNEISGCAAASGGDASSCIVVVGNSPRNKIRFNHLHNSGHSTGGGYGISISASAEGDGSDGTPKLDESPSYTLIEGNTVEYIKDTGIRVYGALHPFIINNYCYENGQRTANTFYNIELLAIEADLDCEAARVEGNHCIGAQPKYQIHIGADVTNAVLVHNETPSGATGTVLDEGTGTTTHP